MFAANAELDVGTGLAALCDGNFHQLADAGLVDGREGVFLHDLQLRRSAGGTSQSRRGSCRAAVCVRSLVPKLKNSAVSGNLVGGQRAARDFNHGADQVVELVAFFSFCTCAATSVNELRPGDRVPS